MDVRVLLDSQSNTEGKQMIPTYMDRADAATGYRPSQQAAPDYDSPLYFRGGWYATVIDRMVAEAKYNLATHISLSCLKHKTAMSMAYRKVRHA
jgi:hypothetical protein